MFKPFILAINGSPHGDGVVAELLDLTLAGAAAFGAEVKRIDLYKLNILPAPGNFSRDPASETVAAMPKDDMLDLYPDILRADALVLGTPVYWMNMSGVMKTFIDRLTPLESDGNQLEGKPAAFIAASKENHGGGESAAMAMATALLQMGCLVPPNGVMWHPGAWEAGGEAQESWAMHDAPRVGKTMVNLIEALRGKEWLE